MSLYIYSQCRNSCSMCLSQTYKNRIEKRWQRENCYIQSDFKLRCEITLWNRKRISLFKVPRSPYVHNNCYWCNKSYGFSDIRYGNRLAYRIVVNNTFYPISICLLQFQSSLSLSASTSLLFCSFSSSLPLSFSHLKNSNKKFDHRWYLTKRNLNKHIR